MSCRGWLLRFVFTHTRQPKPDGRPLYGYKTSNRAYSEALDELRRGIQDVRYGKDPHGLGALFCLYAAETFRREHTEGPWAWETVFRPTGISVPPHQTITRWVEGGLKWWKRDLIVSRSGTREFLITIACEGGLPLRLLQREDARLRHFFRAVMEQYHATGAGGRDIAIAAARREIQRLPRSLRQEVVMILAGELIDEITKLQAFVGDTSSPLGALDSHSPEWRALLPLRLEDQVAEALVSGLVKQSHELVEAAEARLRWTGMLRRGLDGSWRLEKSLTLRDKIPAAAVSGWLGRELHKEDAPRVRLMLRSPGATNAIAWLTRSQTSGQAAAYYRREWLSREAGKVKGGAILHDVELIASDGENEFVLPAQEGQHWGDSPWVFVPTENGGDWRWFAEGSVRTKSEEALAVVPTNMIPEPAVTGEVENLGSCPEVDRQIYRVRDKAVFRTIENDLYQVVCRSDVDSSEAFHLFGERVEGFDNQRPLYRGLPKLTVTGRANPQTSQISIAQWRPMYGQGTWRSGREGCWGRIWLRLIDRSNNFEIVRRKADVLPHGFRLMRSIGVGDRAGICEFSGLEGARVDLVETLDTKIEVLASTDRTRIICSPVRYTNLPRLALGLNWREDGRQLELQLPYPQRGALFELGGRALIRDETVALDRLFGVKITVQDETGGTHFWVSCGLLGPGGGDSDGTRLSFRERLPPLRQGRLEIAMTHWRDRISALLAASEEPDANVRVEIVAGVANVMARIVVSRFDMKIEPEGIEVVTVPWRDLQRLGDDWQERITMELLPLWQPDADPTPLTQHPERRGYWEVPATVPPGPWWVIGRDGAWARFRPLLVNVGEVALEQGSDGGLSAAIRERDPTIRQSELDRILYDLGVDPEHPDWPLLFRYVAMTREFPAAYFDVLRTLVKFPLTLSLALFKADEELFEDTWNFPEQMAFSWALIPVYVWKTSGQRFFSNLRDSLSTIEFGDDLVWDAFRRFRERTVGHRAYWATLCDWLQETLFPNIGLENSALQLLRHMPVFAQNELRGAEMQLQGRHQADETWPDGRLVMDQVDSLIHDPRYRFEQLTQQYRPVRCAPFVAAKIALNGIDVSPMLVHELRLIRNFDGEWFSRAFTIALTAGLAERYPEPNSDG